MLELRRWEPLAPDYGIRTHVVLVPRHFRIRALGDGRVAPGRWVWALGVWALGRFPTISRRRPALLSRRAQPRHAVAARHARPIVPSATSFIVAAAESCRRDTLPEPQGNHVPAREGEGREAAKKIFWALGVRIRALGVWDRALGAATPIRAAGVGGGEGVGCPSGGRRRGPDPIRQAGRRSTPKTIVTRGHHIRPHGGVDWNERSDLDFMLTSRLVDKNRGDDIRRRRGRIGSAARWELSQGCRG